MNGDALRDLVVLVADQPMLYSVLGLLSRPVALGIRPLTHDIYTHPEHDPGCLLRGHDLLRLYVNRYRHALVVFDQEGCGREDLSRDTLERDVQDRLSKSGWGDRATAIAISPELEIWVWSDSPQVDSVLGWAGRQPDLRSWLEAEGFAKTQQNKPHSPKEAFEKALRQARKPKSSSLYRQLAETVSVGRCLDPAFLKFKATLRTWFPREA